MSEERQRVFFALWPDAVLQNGLARWGRAMQHELGGRLTRTETIHLTLAFIGEVAAGRVGLLQAIGSALSCAAFDLEIDRVGCWPHNGVAWAGSATTPAAVTSLVGDLRGRLRTEGFPVEERNFATHLTLLRKAQCVSLNWRPPEPLTWVVRRFVLVRSVLGTEGSTYSELASWPLRG